MLFTYILFPLFIFLQHVGPLSFSFGVFARLCTATRREGAELFVSLHCTATRSGGTHNKTSTASANKTGSAEPSNHTFSAFWLRSSVVSVLISLISGTGDMFFPVD